MTPEQFLNGWAVFIHVLGIGGGVCFVLWFVYMAITTTLEQRRRDKEL